MITAAQARNKSIEVVNNLTEKNEQKEKAYVERMIINAINSGQRCCLPGFILMDSTLYWLTDLGYTVYRNIDYETKNICGSKITW